MGITGIGYQGLTLPQLCQQLHTLDVQTVFDVRLTPLSRKPGFSKTALSTGLRSTGVEYVHLPALGNPKQNRAGFGGSPNELERALRIYRELLRTSPAREALSTINDHAQHQRVALLCFEADTRQCHRDAILTALRGTQTTLEGTQLALLQDPLAAVRKEFANNE